MTREQQIYCDKVMKEIDRLYTAHPNNCKRQFDCPLIEVAVYHKRGLSATKAAEILLGMKSDPVRMEDR